MLTTACDGDVELTRSGRVPKVNFTRSPSSSIASCSALKLNVSVVSPLTNVTRAGTPE